MSGTLYLVATPIGNLEDITLRAIRTLKEVDLIAAEDTRKTIKLLNHLGISKPLTSYFRHNESEKGSFIIEKLLQGENIALVSDAGTPAISDPGEELVKLAIEKNIPICPVPGPSAAISALIGSGLPTGQFNFEGFLPMNKRSRKERLESLKNERRTMIFYEAPHKLVHTLKDMYDFWGERNIVLARELTKIYEEFLRMSLSRAIELYETKDPRGEYVVIVEGISSSNCQLSVVSCQENPLTAKEQVEKYINEGIDKKEAMKKTAQERGIPKREIYKLFMND
jgi:16S rRNA (cytidine1402-2'-O)-methyltransferase